MNVISKNRIKATFEVISLFFVLEVSEKIDH